MSKLDPEEMTIEQLEEVCSNFDFTIKKLNEMILEEEQDSITRFSLVRSKQQFCDLKFKYGKILENKKADEEDF